MVVFKELLFLASSADLSHRLLLDSNPDTFDRGEGEKTKFLFWGGGHCL